MRGQRPSVLPRGFVTTMRATPPPVALWSAFANARCCSPGKTMQTMPIEGLLCSHFRFKHRNDVFILHIFNIGGVFCPRVDEHLLRCVGGCCSLDFKRARGLWTQVFAS